MASPRSHKRQRQHEQEQEQELEPSTTLLSLGDDMLAEILRRLPTLTSLARAAFACPRLGNAASSVNDRSVSPASPLVGYFISTAGGDIPSFHRALLRSDRDVAAIIRRGDFHLADFEDFDWRLMDCGHGLLLLVSDRCLTVFDPVATSRLRIPHCINTSNDGGKPSFYCFLPVPASGDATSFRVLCLTSKRSSRVRPHVYSSCTSEWCSHPPAPGGIRPPRKGDQHSFHHYLPMHAGGRIYWKTSEEKLTSLDVGSMYFSHIPLPEKLSRYSSYTIGESEDGTTCIVAFDKLEMRVWFFKEEDGSSSWERRWTGDVSHLLADRIRVAKVCNVTAGVVLLSTGYKNKGLRYIAFSLKDTLREHTTKFADFFISAGWVHPYFMAWPRPTLKAAGSIENTSTSETEQEAAASSNKKK